MKKKKKSPFFDLDVEQSATDRFIAIQPHLERLLLPQIQKSQKRGARYRSVSMRLLMMGTSRAEAVPEVVVFCHPDQERFIKRLVKQDTVLDMWRSSEPSQRSFDITVVGIAPKLRNGTRVLSDDLHSRGNRDPMWRSNHHAKC